jgi:hypothetical protein
MRSENRGMVLARRKITTTAISSAPRVIGHSPPICLKLYAGCPQNVPS